MNNFNFTLETEIDLDFKFHYQSKIITSNTSNITNIGLYFIIEKIVIGC